MAHAEASVGPPCGIQNSELRARKIHSREATACHKSAYYIWLSIQQQGVLCLILLLSLCRHGALLVVRLQFLQQHQPRLVLLGRLFLRFALQLFPGAGSHHETGRTTSKHRERVRPVVARPTNQQKK